MLISKSVPSVCNHLPDEGETENTKSSVQTIMFVSFFYSGTIVKHIQISIYDSW